MSSEGAIRFLCIFLRLPLHNIYTDMRLRAFSHQWTDYGTVSAKEVASQPRVPRRLGLASLFVRSPPTHAVHVAQHGTLRPSVYSPRPARNQTNTGYCVMGHRNSSTVSSMAERNFLLVAAVSVGGELVGLSNGDFSITLASTLVGGQREQSDGLDDDEDGLHWQLLLGRRGRLRRDRVVADAHDLWRGV